MMFIVQIMKFNIFHLISSLLVCNNCRFNSLCKTSIDSYWIPPEVWDKHFNHQKLKNATIINHNRF